MKISYKKPENFTITAEMIDQWCAMAGKAPKDIRNRKWCVARIESFFEPFEECLISGEEHNALRAMRVGWNEFVQDPPFTKWTTHAREAYQYLGEITPITVFDWVMVNFDFSLCFSTLSDLLEWKMQAWRNIRSAMQRDEKIGILNLDADGNFKCSGKTYERKKRSKPESLTGTVMKLLNQIRSEGGKVSRNGGQNSLVIDHGGKRATFPLSLKGE